MPADDLPFLDAAALRSFAEAHAHAPCPQCANLVCPGWESVPGSFPRSALQRLATLQPTGDEEQTLSEHHPAGTHGWSPNAPIAPAFFPYNRCDVWACKACGRAFLRYTEVGGYYEDERIRELTAGLIDDTRP